MSDAKAWDKKRYKNKRAFVDGIPGKIIDSYPGQVLWFGEAEYQGLKREWFSINDPILRIEQRGRPTKHKSQAEKQRAYRERKKGNALRKYTNNR